MKNLIRNILKEEIENSEQEKKGIDLAVKILKKSYPFIVGWKYNQESESKLYIEIVIICDIEKTKKFYQSELKDYYRRNLEYTKKQEYAYPFSILKISDDLDSDQKFEKYKEMRKEIQDIYEMLPDKFLTMTEYNDLKQIDPDKFVFV